MVVNRGLSWCGMNGCMSSELLDARVEPDGWLDEIWTARLGGQIGYGTARKGKVVWHASSEHWPHSEGSVFLLETCVQAGVACRRRLLGHDRTLDMDIRACVGGLAWMMPATRWLDGGEKIATARKNTIYHNDCRRVAWASNSRCVDAVARSNGRGGMPQYAVLPRATHVDRRRRVSGAALVEEGYLRLLGGY